MAKRKRRKSTPKKKTTKRSRTPQRARRTRRAQPTGGPVVLQGAMQNLQAAAEDLRAQRAAIDAQLTAVEQALAAMGTAPAGKQGRRVGRPPGTGMRAGSLKDYITNVLSGGEVMSVKDITNAVLAAGYPTRNKTLAKSVGIALTEMPNVQKVARGKFRLK